MTPEQMQAYIAQGYTMDQIMAAVQNEAKATQEIEAQRSKAVPFSKIENLVESAGPRTTHDDGKRLPGGVRATVRVLSLTLKETEYGHRAFQTFEIVASDSPDLAVGDQYYAAINVTPANTKAQKRVADKNFADLRHWCGLVLDAKGVTAAPGTLTDTTASVCDGVELDVKTKAVKTNSGYDFIIHDWAPKGSFVRTGSLPSSLPSLPPLPKLG